jgi:hypothetical protein
MKSLSAFPDLWVVETYSQVRYFKSKVGAEVHSAKYRSRYDCEPYQASESQKCWHFTKHKNCEHMK